jgi:hypothetical protein
MTPHQHQAYSVMVDVQERVGVILRDAFQRFLDGLAEA